MRYLFRAIWRSVTMTLFVVGLALSPSVYLAARVLAHASEGAIAEYRLRTIPPERYEAEIRSALDAGDGDLARSLQALAVAQKVAVPEALTQRIAALPPVDAGNVLRQGWDCVVNGDFDSEAGFACVVATDVTGIGDVRDLVGEGGNYLMGRPVNYFTLGAASVGLTLSAATLSSLGAALPLRAGVSFVKALNKVGKLPPKLAREVGLALSRSIDGKALSEAVAMGTSFRLGEMQRPLSRLFRPRSLEMVTDLAGDFATIGKAGGVRAMKLGAEAAETTRDVKVLAKTAEKYEGRFLGVMKLLGRSALRLAELVWTIGGWLLGAALWLLGVALFLMKWTRRSLRLVWRVGRGTARGLWRLAVRPAPAPVVAGAARA